MQTWLGRTARAESPPEAETEATSPKTLACALSSLFRSDKSQVWWCTERRRQRQWDLYEFKASLVYNPLTPGSRTVRALLHRETLSQKGGKKGTVVQDWRIMITSIHSGTLIKTSSPAVPHDCVYLWPPKAGLQASSRNFTEPTKLLSSTQRGSPDKGSELQARGRVAFPEPPESTLLPGCSEYLG